MRIGILGGTFNPIHSAHVQMAQISRDEASLDLVLLMVAADPPHKRVEGEVSANVRLELVRLAAQNEARVEPSDLEIKRGGKSYTLDTLLELQKQYPGAELFLVLGSDTLGDLPNWHKPEEVLKIASVLCVPRIGLCENDEQTAKKLSAKYGAKIRLLGGKADRISSTEIRERLEEGLDITGLLPDAVEQACYESGVYFPPEIQQMQLKLRSALSQKRYRHVCGTMRAAACLAQVWKQDAKKARVASLLHDCAKCLDPLTQEVLSGDDSGVYPVYHAFAGAVLARMEYGITDETVLRAIRLHTTGEDGMSDFDALVYAADLIEPTRTFLSVEEYRRRVRDGADSFMRYSLQRVSRLIAQRGWAVHPASARALAYYERKAGLK